VNNEWRPYITGWGLLAIKKMCSVSVTLVKTFRNNVSFKIASNSKNFMFDRGVVKKNAKKKFVLRKSFSWKYADHRCWSAFFQKSRSSSERVSLLFSPGQTKKRASPAIKTKRGHIQFNTIFRVNSQKNEFFKKKI